MIQLTVLLLRKRRSPLTLKSWRYAEADKRIAHADAIDLGTKGYGPYAPQQIAINISPVNESAEEAAGVAGAVGPRVEVGLG